MSLIHRSSGTGRLLLVLPLLMSMPACSLFDSDDEVAPANLEALLTLAESTAHDPSLGLVCQGSIPVDLHIQGGRGPYEAVFTMSARVGGRVATPYGELTNQTIVVLKQEFAAEGGFRISPPAVQFVVPGTAIESVIIGVLLKDRDSSVSFDNAVPGQPLPPMVENAITNPKVVEEQTFQTLISTCSQP